MPADNRTPYTEAEQHREQKLAADILPHAVLKEARHE